MFFEPAVSAMAVSASRLLRSKSGTRRLDAVGLLFAAELEAEKYLMGEASPGVVVVVADILCLGDASADVDGGA